MCCNLMAKYGVQLKQIFQQIWMNEEKLPMRWGLTKSNTVKCRYNAVFGVQEIDRVIAVTAL